MAGIPLDKAELVAIFLETFLYGIFFTLFWITLWLLLTKRTEERPNLYLITALIFMLILSTSHIIIDFVRIIEAFIVHRDPSQGDPSGYYAQLSHPLHVTKNVLYTTLSLTGDVVMAWRCYIVYCKNRLVIIVPALLIVGSAFCGYAACWAVSMASAGSTIFATATSYITSFLAITLCTNTYCTGMIVYRIWSSIRSIGPRRQGSHGLMPVIMALVESGGLYAAALLALLITYLSGSNGQYAALDVITPIVGITFSLIIIQIDAYASGRTGNSNAAASWRGGRGQAYTSSHSYPMHPVDITVTTHRAIHIDQTHSRPSANDMSKENKHLETIEGGLT